MNAIKNDVQKLVQKELNSANEKFPLFNSPHEGYAVIKEEIEECMDDLTMMLEAFSAAWDKIKNNKYAFNTIHQVKEFAESLAIEAVQVAAMADKYNLSLAGDDVGCCSCGAVIPEGRQICPSCERGASDDR